MADIFLPAEIADPRKSVWKPWKGVGLAAFTLAYLFRNWLPGWLVVPGILFGAVAAINLALHLLRYVKDRVFWRVRNRILGSFIFVGLIPLLLILGTVYLTAYIIAGQLAANYFQSSLRELGSEVSAINTVLGQQLAPRMTTRDFEELAAQSFKGHSKAFPRLAARWLRSSQNQSAEARLVFDPHGIASRLESLAPKKWIGEKGYFEGLMRQDDMVLFTAIRVVPGASGDFLEVLAPLDKHVEQRLQREKSVYCAFADIGKANVKVSTTGVGITVGAKGDPVAERVIEEQVQGAEARRKNDARRMVSWWTLLECKNIKTEEKDVASFAVLHVPLEILYTTYFAESFNQGQILIALILGLLGLFAFAELISLIIGWTISRRITRSVHDLYQGTLALGQGDLLHTIPVRRNDQLGLLAHSFNQMSASITRLLEDVSEKKRLEQELEIAREVQGTLFPKQLPHPRGLSIFGGCEPARVVSGDYYDFIIEDEARLHIVVGDISGKGISAALMMANLQAAMRSQLAASKLANSGTAEENLAEVMQELNRKIFGNSPSEKYVTLFVARYDAETRRLCYCNSGHLAPIVLDDGNVRRLEAGGTVLGLFENAGFEPGTVELTEGTVMLMFTDGITEAVNDADEEFGEERLIAAVRESRTGSPESIYRHVIDQVRRWQGDLKQHDDMTLIVTKTE